MSFRCRSCRKTTRPGIKQERIPIIEPFYHPARYEGTPPFEICIDSGGEGERIVEEVILCPDCTGRPLNAVEQAAIRRHDQRCEEINRRVQSNLAACR